MRGIFVFGAILLGLTAARADSVTVDRGLRAQNAEAAFRDLDFFHKGRGMIMPPGFPPLSSNERVRRLGFDLAGPALEAKFGVLIEGADVVGFKNVAYEGLNVGVVSCGMCHVGRAAGMTIVGLGNKNIDISELAKYARRFTPYWSELEETLHATDTPARRQIAREVRAASEGFIAKLDHPRIRNLTQGLVPIGLIRMWFFEQARLEPDTYSPGQVKVPFLWGYAEKRKVGSFSDGGGNGVKPGWAVAVELVAGQTVENVLEYEPKIHHAEDVLGDLLPPEYPFARDGAASARGQALFVKNCAGCHGTYERDASGYAVFREPKFIPWHVVRTDAERLAGITPLFREVVRTNPLNTLIEQTAHGPGYMAPRLEGVWARFPYLHNGSVPTLEDLLSPVAKRPRLFSLRQAGERERYDAARGGLGTDRRWNERELARRARAGDRRVYDVGRLGHSNEGHEFGFYGELTARDRHDLIEYLKTL